MVGGVSDHSRVLAQMAAARGHDVHVWAPEGAGPMPGVQVHDTLGSFTAADLSRVDAVLNRQSSPRRVVLQWVPHGYGRRGVNVPFSRWIARRAASGDDIDVIVHEPFVDFVGRSWAQPARALIQRYMARLVLRSARRVWLSIPGWASRLDARWLGLRSEPRVLPVPGTIAVDADAAAISRLRTDLPGAGATPVIGYFGAGGAYVERTLALAVEMLCRRSSGVALVCFGRGSDDVAARLVRELPSCTNAVSGTGALSARDLSRHLQACDVLLQPYEDGVSGRRTTTISALEHGVPVATTTGALSEPFWRGYEAVETVPADAPASLANAVLTLLEPDRNRRARVNARELYRERFDPAVAFQPLFTD